MAGKQALVYGGNGALGKACVTTLKNAGFKFIFLPLLPFFFVFNLD